MNVAFVSSEVFPFSKTGGLADVSGSLPQALVKEGVKVSIFTPLYKSIDKKHFAIKSVNKFVSKAKLGKTVDAYFIKNDKFFSRDGLYQDKEGVYNDNLTRFAYFCTKTLESIKELKLKVDIVHCHDWHTALIPVYLKELYSKDKYFKSIKTLLTIHNLAFQGTFEHNDFEYLNLPNHLFNTNAFEFYGQINLLKAGIVYADRVSTVSSQYADEILQPEFGCGLDGVFKSRKDKVAGVINGLDYDVWNPQKDSWIKKPYDKKNVELGKAENKSALQRRATLPIRNDVPIFGFVGRISDQKGLNLIIQSIPSLVKQDLQIIIQGVGDATFTDQLSQLACKYPEKVAFHGDFDEQLAHLIYSGSDLFLMPSKFEPCGLSQMISMAYGTVPIVYKTGGLAESVDPILPRTVSGNGFVFDIYSKQEFIRIIKNVLAAFKNKKRFKKFVGNALSTKFTWEASAKEYKKIYKCLLSD